MRKTKSLILDAVHETAKGLHKADVMNQVTLREFDRLCLPPVEPLEPEQIKRIRESARVSQAVFARAARCRSGLRRSGLAVGVVLSSRHCQATSGNVTAMNHANASALATAATAGCAVRHPAQRLNNP